MISSSLIYNWSFPWIRNKMDSFFSGSIGMILPLNAIQNGREKSEVPAKICVN